MIPMTPRKKGISMRAKLKNASLISVGLIALSGCPMARAEVSPGEMLRYAETVTWICDDESDSDYMEDGRLNTITQLKIQFTNDTGHFEGSARTTLTGNSRHLWRRLELEGQAFVEENGTGFIVERAVETYATPLPEDIPWRAEREAIFWIEPDTGSFPFRLVGKWRAADDTIAYSKCSLD